jgi:HEAT repeat protein
MGSREPVSCEVTEELSGWEKLLSPLAGDSEGLEATAEKLSRLPGPARKVAALILVSIPLAAKEIEMALAPLSPEQKESLREFGPLLLIADDKCRVDFEPPHPERARRIAQKHPGKKPLAIVLESARGLDMGAFVRAGAIMAELADGVSGILREITGPERSAMKEACLFRWKTRYGVLILAGTGNDTHFEPAPFHVDFGGDDLYRGKNWGGVSGVESSPLALLVDAEGDDVYICGGTACLGGAFLGAAAFEDLGGDDVYRGEDLCMGAALFGAASFVDHSGADDYRAGAFCQGAACFAVALMREQSGGTAPAGGDRYRAGEFAQGFARTMGAACLHDGGGHDSYRAGGRIPYLPLYKRRHFSHSQGFAIGVREHGAAGGVAMLLDEGGDDHYMAEIHAQGAACWYGVGILYDRRGDDRYGVTFNGQGSSVHEAVGILIDGEGDDTYGSDDGLVQGAAHDFAVGLLVDGGGNDKYLCRACGQGVGLTNGVGILIERGGNDIYAASEGHLQGAGRPRRHFGSIGLLVDMGGRDAYSAGPKGFPPEGRADGAHWALGEFGCGIDLMGSGNEGKSEGDGWGAGPVKPVEVDLPAEYEFSGEKFARLFEAASLWDVGADRVKVARARGELVAWGPRALPFMKNEMKRWGGLYFWALDSILSGISASHRPDVVAFLLEALNGTDSVSRANGLRLVGKLEIGEAGEAVSKLLRDPSWRMYAVVPAGRLRLNGAVPTLLAALEEGRSDQEVITVLRALARIGDPKTIPALIGCFSRPSFPQRFASIRALPLFGGPAVAPLMEVAGSAESKERVRAHAMSALALFEEGHRTEKLLTEAVRWTAESSWILRAHAVKLVASFSGERDGIEVLTRVLEGEDHPFVRGVIVRKLAVLRGELPEVPEMHSGIVDYPEYEED